VTTTAFSHVILTRFSVRAYPAAPPHTSDWLAYRTDLFEAYCASSMSAQTCQNFAWLVFCDESTQQWCVQRLRHLAKEVPQLKVVLTSPAEPSYRSAEKEIRPGDEVLITTRLDSDDATSIDFVERIQNFAPGFVASKQEAVLVSFSRGFKLLEDHDRLFECWYPHSGYLSLFEHVDALRPSMTVQSGDHGFLPERYPIHVDAGPPAWIQVIHGGNVRNRVWSIDRETSMAALNGRFVVNRDRTRSAPVAPDLPRSEDRKRQFRQALEESLLGSQSDHHQVPGHRPIQDRITEVYEGELGELELQGVARNRVDWMCGQARGRTLDVGCSQGIATILLARSGITCIGIDHELDQVSAAVAYLAQEDPEAARHARFVAADAAGLPFADGYFETVLLGGVLGRLKDPGRVLTECRRVLAPSGRLVITTPFGADPHEDLRSVYFPASLAELVDDHAALLSLEIVDHHIRLLAEAGGDAPTNEIVREAQPGIDAIHHAQQQELYSLRDQAQVLEDRLERTRTRVERKDEQLDRLRSRVERKDEQLDRLRARIARLERRVARSERQVLAMQANRWFRLGVVVRRLVRPLRPRPAKRHDGSSRNG
jgi:ubiquinone/menaquinone biosynthesis C-methylase UbiE